MAAMAMSVEWWVTSMSTSMCLSVQRMAFAKHDILWNDNHREEAVVDVVGVTVVDQRE
jgi:hypothetical protein